MSDPLGSWAVCTSYKQRTIRAWPTPCAMAPALGPGLIDGCQVQTGIEGFVVGHARTPELEALRQDEHATPLQLGMGITQKRGPWVPPTVVGKSACDVPGQKVYGRISMGLEAGHRSDIAGVVPMDVVCSFPFKVALAERDARGMPAFMLP